MQYHTPSSFSEAMTLAVDACGSTRFLVGGTDILVQMRADIFTPDVMIDLKQIPGVGEISHEADGGWTIGVAVPGAVMREHSALGRDWPGLVEAVDLIGSTQVQGRATMVGNLMNASPAADAVPAMIAAAVEVSIQGPDGVRRMAVETIPTGPGQTALTRGELITAVHIPARGRQGGDAYQRFIPRSEMDIAVVGCGVNLRLEGGKVAEARVALGAVAPTALLVAQAAQAIIGTSLDEAALQALSTATIAACAPIDDKRGTAKFRKHVAGVLVRRVTLQAYRRAGGEV